MTAFFYPSLTKGELVGNFNAAQSSGLYLKSLAMYASPEDPRYAAIFLPIPPGREIVQALETDASLFTIGSLVSQYGPAGFFPAGITATGTSSSFAHTLWFQRGVKQPGWKGSTYFDTPTMKVVAMRLWNQFSADDDHDDSTPLPDLIAADRSNHNLVSLDLFQFGVPSPEYPSDVYACAIFQTDPALRTSWHPLMETYGGREWHTDARYVATQRSWARPEALIPLRVPSQFLPFTSAQISTPASLVTLWMGDTLIPWPANMDQATFTGGTFTRGPFFRASSQSAASQLADAIEAVKATHWPIHVGANGPIDDPTFAVTFAPNGKTQPLGRLPVTVGIRDVAPPKRVPYGKYAGSTHLLASAHASLMADASPFQSQMSDYQRAVELGWDGPAPTGEGVATKRRRRGLGGAPPNQAPSQGPTSGALPAQGLQPTTDPFAPLIFALMERRGIRGAQLAIARDGRLVYAKAFTLAEPNYPVLTTRHLVRVGSLSKGFTAMRLVAHYGSEEGLDQNLADELGIIITPSGPNVELMGLVRVQDALRHRTGWGGTNEGNNTFDDRNIRAVLHKTSAEPGDVSPFLANTEDAIFIRTGFPRLTASYSNWNFAVLGELVSRLESGTVKNYRRYEAAMRAWWGLPLNGGPGLPRIFQGSWELERVLGAAPAHLRLPGYGSQPDDTLDAYQYVGADLVAQGAGGWQLSAVQAARLLAGMDPGAATVYLDAAQVRLIHAPYTVEPGGTPYLDGGGLAFFYSTRQHHFGKGPVHSHKKTTCIKMTHNGAESGGSSVACHLVPSLGEVTPSVTVVLTLNQDTSLDDTQIDAILDLVEDYELTETWGGEDLFGVS